MPKTNNLDQFKGVIDRFENGEITFNESIIMMRNICDECTAELAEIGLGGAALPDVAGDAQAA